MAVARYYSSNAVDTTLSVGCNSSATSITVASTTGFPTSYPFTLAIDYDTSSEELVDVTAAAGTTLTVTRGVDGTTAQAHSAGAVIKHAISGRDMREAQEHINATGRYSVANGATTEYFDLHGLGSTDGNVVGTTKTQTLTNKTLTSPAISGATLSGTTTLSGTISANSTTITATELGYVDGATSNLQTQINSKAPTASPTFTGTVTLPSGTTISAPTLTGTVTNSGTISGGTVSAATVDNSTITNTAFTTGVISSSTLTSTITNSGTISGGTVSGATLSGTTTNSGTISGGTIAGTITNTATITGGTLNPTTLKQNSITLPLAFSSGTVSVSVSSSTTGTATVTFPTSRFTVTPVIVASTGNSQYSCSISSPSSTQTDIIVRRIDGTAATTTVTVYWTAIQQTSTAYSAGTAQ